MLVDRNFYSYVDDRNERINKKIREAQIAKAKIQIVIGDEEIETQQLSLRFYGSEQIIKIHYNELLSYLHNLTQESQGNKLHLHEDDDEAKMHLVLNQPAMIEKPAEVKIPTQTKADAEDLRIKIDDSLSTNFDLNSELDHLDQKVVDNLEPTVQAENETKKPEAKTEDLTKPKGAKKAKTKVDQQQIIVDLNARKHKRFSNFDHPSKMFSFFKQETNSQ